jgi:NitT/TauT family transport system substrate-binding protein
LVERQRFLRTAGALVAAGAVPRPAAAQTPALDLRIAANANDTFASAYYALDEGFFTRAGLNASVQTISNGAAITAAVIGGTMDIGVAVPVTLGSAYLRGLPVVIVAAGSMSITSVPTTRLCVLATSPIKSAQDLAGGTVAINALNVGLDLSLNVWLAANGVDRSAVKEIEVPFAEMGVALERHAVAAAIISEPSYTVLARQTPLRTLTNINAAISGQYVSSCWFSTRDFVQQHPEHIRRFIRAIYDAQRWANTHHDASGAILAKYSSLDLAVVHSMTRAHYADALRASDVQPFFDVAVKFGGLSGPVSATNLIYQP